jgi:hypothetical protein
VRVPSDERCAAYCLSSHYARSANEGATLMARTPVPRGGPQDCCFQESEQAHADPKSEFAYLKPVTRPVISRSKADAAASGMRPTAEIYRASDSKMT